MTEQKVSNSTAGWIALHALLLIIALPMFIITIWSKDERWLHTGFVFIALQVALFAGMLLGRWRRR